LILWEHDEQPLRTTHLEDWYTSNVWTRVVDDCFLSLPQVSLQRKEATCQSTALRRNRNRDEVSTRQKIGPRLDGLLRSTDDNSHEFCAIEAATELRGGTFNTKWLSDKAKLSKVLRDMLSRLISAVDHDADVVARLQVVGLSMAGLTMQAVRLCHGKGYVSLLVAEPSRTAPSAVGRLRELLKVLTEFVRVKAVLCETIHAFNARLPVVTDDEEAEHEAAEPGSGEAVSSMTGRRRIPRLPRPADTP
jgi:hypothetical protein